MSATTGICEYVYINASTTPFGLVTGGSLKYSEAPEHRTGVGGKDNIVGKLVVPTASIDFMPINITIPGYAFRASTNYPCSALTATTIGVGANAIERKVTAAKCNSLSLSCAVDGPLEASMEFMGTGYTETTYSVPSQTVGNHYEWYYADVDINGITTVNAVNFSVSIENNCEALSNLTSKSSGSKRVPTQIVEGHEMVKVDVTTHEPIASATLGVIADDLVTNITFTATMTKVGGSGTLTIAVTNLACGSAEEPIEVDGVLEYSYSFEAKHSGGVITLS